MALGFELQQSLSGTFHRLSDPGVERPLRLELRARVPLVTLLRRGGGALDGVLDAEGYASRAPLQGQVTLRPADGKLVYDFRFDADDGRPRRFHGETEVHLRRLVRTLEDLVGRIYDDDGEELRVLARVPLDVGLFRLLRSLRASFTTRV